MLGLLDENNRDLRYVLKNRRTGDVYLVVLFMLLEEDSEKASQDGNDKTLQDEKDQDEHQAQAEGEVD